MKRFLLTVLIVAISLSVKAQFMEPAQAKALDTLQKLAPLFKVAKNDSLFVLKYSDKPVRYYTFERGDQEEDIEEQLYNTPVGEVAGPFRGEGTTNYIFKVLNFEEYSYRSRANIIYLKPNDPSKEDTTSLKKLAKKYADALSKGKNAKELAEKDGVRLIFTDMKWYYEAEKDDHNKKPFHDMVVTSEKGKTYVVTTDHGPSILQVTNSHEKTPFKIKVIAVVKKGDKL